MDKLTVTMMNFDEAQAAFNAASDVGARFAKTALFRFARRVAKNTKRNYLHGGAGIKGGRWARLSDKNIRGFTVGGDLSNLKAVSKVSRIVRTHVEGAVITPQQAGLLFLRKKSGAGPGSVFALMRAVTIPARIPFESVWRGELPRGTKEVGDAIHRAVNLTLDQRMKVISQYLNKVVSHS